LHNFFSKKLRLPPLVDPWAVEIDIFVHLTISKRVQNWDKLAILRRAGSYTTAHF
jgi:hypothetical protein